MGKNDSIKAFYATNGIILCEAWNIFLKTEVV